MEDKISIITLIALIVAVVAIIKLRSVLGRHTDDDDARIDRHYRESQESKNVGQGNDNVVTLPNVRRQEASETHDPAAALKEGQERIRKFGGDHKEVVKGLLELFKKDVNFYPEQFVDGARHAYELIVTAFAEGNRSELKKLLHRDVFDSFDRAITDRETRGELIDQSFVGIEKADVLEVDVNSSTANITMRFVSQLISATRGKDGSVISGDTQKIKEVTDIWTFSRDISNARALENPNWKLVATQSPH